MKKITSLFLSALIVCSMILCSVAFEASASSAPQLYKTTEYLNIDSSANLTGWTYGATSGNSPVIDGQTNYALLTHRAGEFTKSEGVLKITPSSWSIFEIKPDTAIDNRDPSKKLTEGKFEVTGSVKKDDGATFGVHSIREVHANRSNGVQTNRVDYESINGNFTVLTSNPDKWYDFSILVDLDNNKYQITIIDPDNPSEPAESGRGNYNYDFGILRFTVGTTSTKFIYLKNLKATHTSEPYMSSIIDVGSDGNVGSDTDELTFRLDNEIKNLDKSHIYLIDANGNRINVTNADITTGVADNGGDGLADSIVTLSLASKLKSWTDYTIHIDKSCYDGYQRKDNEPIENLTYSFSTPAGVYDARAIKTISAGRVEYVAEVANRTTPNLPVTLMLAVYDSDGSMVSLTNYSIENSYNSDGTTITHTISADISDGQTAILFMIDGWAGMRPLFGRTW